MESRFYDYIRIVEWPCFWLWSSMHYREVENEYGLCHIAVREGYKC